jgi:hypothetical protein
MNDAPGVLRSYLLADSIDIGVRAFPAKESIVLFVTKKFPGDGITEAPKRQVV